MSNLWQFVNSPFFTSIVTLFVGLIAYLLYQKQKKDKKRDIANAIIAEVQYVEKAIDRVKDYVRDTEKSDISIQIIQQNSWATYKHMFSSDFDKDEWKLISEFFNNSFLLDRTLEQSNAVFESNATQIRSNLQRGLADLVEHAVVNMNQENLEENLRLLNERLGYFSSIYEDKKNNFTYTPLKHLNDTRKILEDIQPVSTSTAGAKLKKIAGIS